MSDLLLNGHFAGLAHTDDLGDFHVATASDTPMNAHAFDLSDAEKIERISDHFAEIMHLLGLDLRDDSLRGTPRRVAKMYVNEIFRGLNPANKPAVTTFENKYQYRRLVVERNIPLQSTCEHHFQPIFGVAHVAYIPNGRVVGLSKLNRIVDFFARRPQVQERLTMQIAESLMEALKPLGVAVVIEALHLCMAMRGVEKSNSSTVTSAMLGSFRNSDRVRSEFLSLIGKK